MLMRLGDDLGSTSTFRLLSCFFGSFLALKLAFCCALRAAFLCFLSFSFERFTASFTAAFIFLLAVFNEIFGSGFLATNSLQSSSPGLYSKPAHFLTAPHVDLQDLFDMSSSSLYTLILSGFDGTGSRPLRSKPSCAIFFSAACSADAGATSIMATSASMDTPSHNTASASPNSTREPSDFISDEARQC